MSRRPPVECAECGRVAPRTRRDGDGRVCMGCWARRRHPVCPDCGQTRPPWGRPPGTACGLCVVRAEAATVMAGYRNQVVAAVTAVEADLAPDAVAGAVEWAAPHREARRVLAEAVASDPGWFAGSVVAPRAVDRLVAELQALGARRVEQPRCGNCGRPSAPAGRRSDGTRLCKACDTRSRRAQCACCGRDRPVGGHLSDGRAICGTCRRNQPERLKPCVDCGETRVVGRYLPDGAAICPRCYMRRARAGDDMPGLVVTCIDCGRRALCIGVSIGQPRCRRCYGQRRAACAGCGRTVPVAVVWAAGPHCHRCRETLLNAKGRCDACGQVRRIDPRNAGGGDLCTPCAGLEPFSTCAICGTEARLYERGRCPACTLQRRIEEFFTRAADGLAEQLAPLRAALVTEGNPATTLDWLARPAPHQLLTGLVEGTVPVTHDALDAYGSKTADHLRYLLVSAGVLPTRDEALARLERWLTEQLDAIDRAEDRHLIETFATWHVLRRLRRRASRIPGGVRDTGPARRSIRTAIDLLAWLHQHRRPLGELTQADIDLWLAGDPPSRRRARPFLRWAAERRLAPGVKIPTRPIPLPAATLTTDDLQGFVHRLATDTTLPVAVRTAGLLVTLYAQPASRLVRLRVNDVTLDNDGTAVALRLGETSIELPPVLAQLVTQLLADRRGFARTAAPATSPWLFPGGRPGQALGPNWLAARITALGLPITQIRTTALIDLAAQLPAAFLRDLLGLSTTTAVRWTQAAAGDWAGYAAIRARPNPD